VYQHVGGVAHQQLREHAGLVGGAAPVRVSHPLHHQLEVHLPAGAPSLKLSFHSAKAT
jgi:hypothetical protein